MNHSIWARGPLATGVRVARSGVLIVAVSLVTTLTAFAQTLPAGWAIANVGDPVSRGTAASFSCANTVSSNCLAVTAFGSGIGGTSDQFVFVYTALNGNGSIVARVDSFRAGDVQAEAGVMIRESTAADARYGLAFVSPGGVAYQRRSAAGGSSTRTNGSGRPAPVWVRLDRAGSALTAYESTDGLTWTPIGTDTIALASTVYVGVAATSHDVQAVATAVFSQIKVGTAAIPEPPSTSAPPPVVTPPSVPLPDEPPPSTSIPDPTPAPASESSQLPSGWGTSDIGAPSIPGGVEYVAGTFAVSGAGTDIWGTSDQFRYAYRAVSGDVDVIARVRAIVARDAWAKAGVMIRASLAPGAAQAHMLKTSGNGLAFQRRLAYGAQTIHTAAGSGANWLKLERRGNAVSAYASADGSVWQFVGSDLFELPASFYVGLAVTSHNASAIATSIFDLVTVRQVSSPGTTSTSGTTPTDTVQTPPASTASTPPPSSPPTTSTPVPTSVSRRVAFGPSPDHYATVEGYVLEIALAATPSVTLLRLDLGKPSVSGGECTADISSVVRLLPAGSYIAVVKAYNYGGYSSGAVALFTM